MSTLRWGFLGIFLGARFPIEVAFNKVLGLVSQKLITQNNTKEDPLGLQGVESLRWGWGRPSLPPKSATGLV